MYKVDIKQEWNLGTVREFSFTKPLPVDYEPVYKLYKTAKEAWKDIYAFAKTVYSYTIILETNLVPNGIEVKYFYRDSISRTTWIISKA